VTTTRQRAAVFVAHISRDGNCGSIGRENARSQAPLTLQTQVAQVRLTPTNDRAAAAAAPHFFAYTRWRGNSQTLGSARVQDKWRPQAPGPGSPSFYL